jgi:predicted O-linked N-acetylglucosamine transferase (SPINDLY family)
MAPDVLDRVQRLLIEGVEAQQAGDPTKARRTLAECLRLAPMHPGVLYSLGALDAQDGDLGTAIARFKAALALKPDFDAARTALAALKGRLGAPADTPSSTSPTTLSETIAAAQGRLQAGDTAGAVAVYGAYLQRPAPESPHVALFNAGVALSQAGRRLEGEAYVRQSVTLQPDFLHGHLSLGQMAEAAGRPDEALAIWEAALQQPASKVSDARGTRVSLLNQVGRLRELRREYPAAEAALAESLQLEPQQPAVLHHWIHLRQKQCVWPVIPGTPEQRAQALASASALAMLGLSDDPAEQLASARRYVDEKVGRFPRRVPRGHDYGHHRLRIGYLSSDLSMHAVSLLTVELFETHHRDRVEVHAFCWSREDGTPFRERVRRAFDRFHRIDAMDDEAAAQLIQAEEIDVLVDLHGLTSNARPNIVARGPAPLQVTYLGLPGPTALPHVDHVVADPFIFPDVLRDGFTEEPLVLPTLYQCSDSQRPIGPLPSRASLGLPDDAFVFCAFNNNFKFTPEVFESWMRILRRVPRALLWLLEDNPWSRNNLQAAARAHGVDPARLLFAGRVQPSDYLARFTAADLFLDTYPYNAGTTANDALWAGLPLLTRSGRTYVSRMAGSLLTSAGLHELVTHNADDYERVAVELALEPERLIGLRRRLADEKASGRLFNTERFATEFEDALTVALRRAGAAAPGAEGSA